jgi:hypothetical protein
MATAAQMRRLALGLPETEEKSHFEQPDFRVCGKIFAGLSRDEKRGTLKLTPEMQGAVIDSKPATYFPAAGSWGRKGWTHVTLVRAQVAELAHLLTAAWRLTAPRRLVVAAKQPPPSSPPRARRRAVTSARGA